MLSCTCCCFCGCRCRFSSFFWFLLPSCLLLQHLLHLSFTCVFLSPVDAVFATANWQAIAEARRQLEASMDRGGPRNSLWHLVVAGTPPARAADQTGSRGRVRDDGEEGGTLQERGYHPAGLDRSPARSVHERRSSARGCGLLVVTVGLPATWQLWSRPWAGGLVREDGCVVSLPALGHGGQGQLPFAWSGHRGGWPAVAAWAVSRSSGPKTLRPHLGFKFGSKTGWTFVSSLARKRDCFMKALLSLGARARGMVSRRPHEPAPFDVRRWPPGRARVWGWEGGNGGGGIEGNPHFHALSCFGGPSKTPRRLADTNTGAT